MYRAMAMGYEAFPSDDTLEAICRYIMLGNPREPEYFRWFSLAVEHGLRLTRLYEYYVEHYGHFLSERTAQDSADVFHV